MNHVAWKPFSQTIEKKIDGISDVRMGIAFMRPKIHLSDDLNLHDANFLDAGPLPVERRIGSTAGSIDRMAVKIGNKIVLLLLREILWIQSKGDWICFHAEAADYDCRMTMTDVQTQLDPGMFLRVHRNAIVNLSQVLEFSLPRTGNAFVHLRNGKTLPISKTGRSTLRQYLLARPCFD